jgi:hypothetical protein
MKNSQEHTRLQIAKLMTILLYRSCPSDKEKCDSIFSDELRASENICRSFMVYGNIRAKKISYDKHLSANFEADIFHSFELMAKMDHEMLRKEVSNRIDILQLSQIHTVFRESYLDLLKYQFDLVYQRILYEEGFCEALKRFFYTAPASEEDKGLLCGILESIVVIKDKDILHFVDKHIYSPGLMERSLQDNEVDSDIRIVYLQVLAKLWSRSDAIVPPTELLKMRLFKSLSHTRNELFYFLNSFLSLLSNEGLLKAVDSMLIVEITNNILFHIGITISQSNSMNPAPQKDILALTLSCLCILTTLDSIRDEILKANLNWLIETLTTIDPDIQALSIAIVANCCKTLNGIHLLSSEHPKFLDQFIEIVHSHEANPLVKLPCIEVINNCMVVCFSVAATSEKAFIDIRALTESDFIDQLALSVTQCENIPLLESISLLLRNMTFVLSRQDYVAIMKSSTTTILVKKALTFYELMTKERMLSSHRILYHRKSFARYTTNIAEMVYFQVDYFCELIQDPTYIVAFLDLFSKACCERSRCIVFNILCTLLDKGVFKNLNWGISISEVVSDNLMMILYDTFKGKEESDALLASEVLFRLIELLKESNNEHLVHLFSSSHGTLLVQTQLTLVKRKLNLTQFDDAFRQYAITSQAILQSLPVSRDCFMNSTYDFI